MEIIIASLPDREKLVAELWYENKQWGELSQEQDIIKLELYSNPGDKYWIFEFDEVLEALKQAKRKLIGED